MGLLRVAKYYFDKSDTNMYFYAYESFIDYFPQHGKAPQITFILERFTIEVSRCSTKKASRLPRREKPLRTLV